MPLEVSEASLNSWPARWEVRVSEETLSRILTHVAHAKVVGLGESVHATGGQYDAKAQMIRYLVEHGGYRTIALETPAFDASAIGKYVETCEGDPAGSGWDMWGVFDDFSTTELFRWMCEWNTVHPDDRVDFVGFDVQERPATYDRLREWLAESFSVDLGTCSTQWTESCSADAAVLCSSALSSIQPSTVSLQVAARTLEWAQVRCAEPARNVLSMKEHRDEAMADILLARAGERRTIVWAHNAHVATEVGYLFDGRFKSMGSHLRERLGDDYVSLALSSSATGITWDWAPIHPPPEGRFGRRLSGAGDVVFEAMSERWFSRWMGVGDLWVRPAHSWSGVFHIRESRPTFPLRQIEAVRAGRVSEARVCLRDDQTVGLTGERVAALAARALVSDGWSYHGSGWQRDTARVVSEVLREPESASWCASFKSVPGQAFSPVR